MKPIRLLPIGAALLALIAFLLLLSPGERNTPPPSSPSSAAQVESSRPDPPRERGASDTATPDAESTATATLRPDPESESPPGPESRLVRGPHRDLVFSPEELSTRPPATGALFGEAFFRVRPEEVSGPLTVNEHTLSAIEAEYAEVEAAAPTPEVDPALLTVQPDRLEMVSVDRPISFQAFLDRYPSAAEPQVVALINGVEVGGTLPEDRLLKRVRGGG